MANAVTTAGVCLGRLRLRIRLRVSGQKAPGGKARGAAGMDRDGVSASTTTRRGTGVRDRASGPVKMRHCRRKRPPFPVRRKSP